MPVYDLSSGFAGLNQGIKDLGAALQSDYKQQYLQGVGSKLAAGDYEGAANLAYAHGDIQTAQGIEQFRQQKQANALLNSGLAGLLGSAPPNVPNGATPELRGPGPQGAGLPPAVPPQTIPPGASPPSALPAGAVPSAAGALLPQLRPVAAQAAQQYGLDPSYLPVTLGIESAGGRNLGSRGNPGQFDKGTAQEVGMPGATSDPAQSVVATAALAVKRAQELQSRIGRMPTPAETYLAHQQGTGGATALITADPQKRAADIVGLAAVANNLPASLRDQASTMPAQQFARFQIGRWNALARSQGFDPGETVLAPARPALGDATPSAAPGGAIADGPSLSLGGGTKGVASVRAPSGGAPQGPVIVPGEYDEDKAEAFRQAMPGHLGEDDFGEDDRTGEFDWSDASPAVLAAARQGAAQFGYAEDPARPGHFVPGTIAAPPGASASPGDAVHPGDGSPPQRAAILQLPPAAAKSVATTIATTLPGSSDRLNQLLRLQMLAGMAKNQGASDAIKILIEMEKGKAAPTDAMRSYALQIQQERDQQQRDLAAGRQPKPLTPYADFVAAGKTPEGRSQLEYALRNWATLGFPDPSRVGTDPTARAFWSAASRKALGM